VNDTATATTLEDLTEAQAEHQKRVSKNARREPGSIGDILNGSPHRDLADRLADPAYQQQQQCKRAERERKAAELARANREADWEALARKIGKRHATCTLDNFVAETDPQRDVLAAAKRYRDELRQRVERGSNLLIFGPVGTGKDHLMVSLLRDGVLTASASADWVNGLRLFRQLRDVIGGNKGEEKLIRHLAKPDVLAISDPSSNGDEITPFQRTFLQDLIDERYRQLRSTWLTINAAGRDGMESVLGVPTVSRLGQDCLAIHCDWTDHRRGGTRSRSDDKHANHRD